MLDSGAAEVIVDYESKPILFGVRAFYLGKPEGIIWSSPVKRRFERIPCDNPLDFLFCIWRFLILREFRSHGR